MQNRIANWRHAPTRGYLLLLSVLLLVASTPARPAMAAQQGAGAAQQSEPAQSAEPDSVKAEGSQGSGRYVSRGAMLVGSLTVFFLAVFVGFEVITKVPPTLHTPLMSGSNAISGITVVGAMLTAGAASIGLGSVLGMLALVLATINVVGGFLVTYRMLKMFQGSKK